MQKQERRFSLAEVHTPVGTMGEVQLDTGFLNMLGVKPGDRIVFSIDAQGVVTVKGERQEQGETVKPPAVTQAALFADAPLPALSKRRARKR